MENSSEFEPLEGGCTCGEIRYRMKSTPLVVHGCHCRLCQKQTGTAFATNILVEAEFVELTAGTIRNVTVETPSGSGQRIARCPTCQVAVWSEYLVMTQGITDLVYFIRAGTLDQPEACPPDVHIYTASKQPWVTFPPGVPVVEEYYVTDEVWAEGSLKRREKLRQIVKEKMA